MKKLSPTDWRYAWRARRAGVPPGWASRVIAEANRYTHVTRSLALALVEQESNFSNVFGHDPTIYVGAGNVTKGKYLAYKQQRGHSRMQGVGPAQLTWWEFQDEADREGGCWNPAVNIRVGLRILDQNIRQHGLHNGVARYNGTGAAASHYATQVIDKAAKWHHVLTRGDSSGRAGVPVWVPEEYVKHWRAPWTSAAARSKKFHLLLWYRGYVSPHFTKAEWRSKDSEPPQHGPDDVIPPSSIRSNVQRHGFALERFRHLMGDVPIPLGSAYRSPARNKAVGGAGNSRHMHGDATDIFKSWVDQHGRSKSLNAAYRVWARGGVGNETSGTLHVDSRGFRARFVTWTAGR